MSKAVIMIVGEAGTGKSQSMFPSKELGIQGLDPAETFFISVQKTELPMRGWKKKYTTFNSENPKGNYVKTDNIANIIQLINYISANRPEIKNICVDDYSFLAANEYFRRIKETGFNY